MSKSPTRRLGRLKGKLKLTEQEKSLHIRMFLLYFHYSTLGVVGRFQSNVSTKSVVLNFATASPTLMRQYFSGLFFTVVSFGQHCIVEWRDGW